MAGVKGRTGTLSQTLSKQPRSWEQKRGNKTLLEGYAAVVLNLTRTMLDFLTTERKNETAKLSTLSLCEQSSNGNSNTVGTRVVTWPQACTEHSPITKGERGCSYKGRPGS